MRRARWPYPIGEETRPLFVGETTHQWKGDHVARLAAKGGVGGDDTRSGNGVAVHLVQFRADAHYTGGRGAAWSARVEPQCRTTRQRSSDAVSGSVCAWPGSL